MQAAAVEGLHLTLTPERRASAADSARAAEVAALLRNAIEKYRDPRAAEADGYKLFAPGVKQQRVYHYSKLSNAIAAAFAFDPARPTSLLYTRESDGTLRLIGAMYTAPHGTSLEELDRRVPLALARWHEHTNLCVPKWRERTRWRETRDGQPLFGPHSPIATRDACEAVGGVFRPRVFGWMVHVNVFEADPWAGHHHGGA